jgi:hypothetical protein
MRRRLGAFYEFEVSDATRTHKAERMMRAGNMVIYPYVLLGETDAAIYHVVDADGVA